MGQPTTSALVLAAAKGDQRAWDALVDAHAQLVWTVIRNHRLSPADAGDAYQTTWLRLVENLDTLREPDRLPSWLVTTARRECLRVQRGNRREIPDLDVAALVDHSDPAHSGPASPRPAGPDPESAFLRDESRRHVVAAFERLPLRCRLILGLGLAEPPIEYADIAAMLGLSRGSIGPTRRRCLDTLRDLLADDTR